MSPEQAAGEPSLEPRPTSTPSAWCCTRCWPAGRRSPAPPPGDPPAGDRRRSPARSPQAQDRSASRRRGGRAGARETARRPLADSRRVRPGVDGRRVRHGEPAREATARWPPSARSLGCLGWLSLARSAGSGFRQADPRAVHRPDPVQHRARSGRRAHLHAHRPPEPRRPAALRHRHGRPAGRGAAPAVRSAADGSDPGRRARRPGDRQQPAVRLAGRPLDRLRQAGKAVEGPGGRRARRSISRRPTGPAGAGAGTAGWSTRRSYNTGLCRS